MTLHKYVPAAHVEFLALCQVNITLTGSLKPQFSCHILLKVSCKSLYQTSLLPLFFPNLWPSSD